mgnify:CR=1 FL=1
MSDFQLIFITVIFTALVMFLWQHYIKDFGWFDKFKKNTDDYVNHDSEHHIKLEDVSKIQSYTQLIEVIDEYEKHQETDQQKDLIAELKKKMKEMLAHADSYEDRLVITTYCIENIFNVLNNKKTISFNEFYKILSNQIVASKSFDPAFKSYVKNRRSGGRF